MRYPKPFYRAKRRLWYIQIDGRQYNLETDSEEEADIRAAELKKRLAQVNVEDEGDLFGQETVIGMIQRFMKHVRATLAVDTIEWYRYRLQRFIDHLTFNDNGELLIADFRPFHVTEWVDTFNGLKAGSKRNYIRAVQRVFNWAAEEVYIRYSPIAKMKKPAGGKRERIISPTEYELVLSLVRNDLFRDLLIVSWEIGCRPQESLIVEARHVDLKNSRWHFPKSESKGEKFERIVYLTDRALKIVRKLMLAHSEGPLFRNADGVAWTTDAINCAFIQLQTRLGKLKIERQKVSRKRLPEDKEVRATHLREVAKRRKQKNAHARKLGTKFCLYHFRHTWINRLLTSGVDSLTVAVLAGHVDPSTVAKTYQHLSQNPAYLLSEAKRAG